MKRPCVLIVTACLLGELLGYYFSIYRLAAGIPVAAAVLFVLNYKKNYKIQINLLSDIFSDMQYLYFKNQI